MRTGVTFQRLQSRGDMPAGSQIPPQLDPLAGLVLSVAGGLNLTCPETCDQAHCTDLCPPAMVPFLTYCYAAGVFSSEEVEELATHDSSVNALMHTPKWPTSVMIRLFRKTHWALLKQCLADVLATARAWDVRLDFRSTAELSWEGGTPLEEAEERLQLALYLDTVCMDE